MTTYYSLNVTNRCNKACPYCVNKPYVNKREYPDIMDFESLKNWLEYEIKENDIVEIAGTGEPTLCHWLPELLRYLDSKKTWTILRTNGFGLGAWRLALGRVLAIMARHDSGDDYVRDRLQWLLPNDIVLDAITEETMQDESALATRVATFFQNKGHSAKRAFCISPDGKIRFMPCENKDMGTVWDYKPEGWDCTSFEQCPFLVNAWNFAEYLKQPFDLPQGCGHVQAKNCKRGA